MKINYNRGLVKQIEELTEQNERLQYENKQLRTENRELRAKLSHIESTMEARINAAVEKAVRQATETLLAEIAEKNALTAKMSDEIDRLKAQINKDSSNSSKPPGQDGFKKIPNSREKSERKSGGQKGHPGKSLSLPKDIDELVEKGIVHREIVDHTNGKEKYITRYELDMSVKVKLTEYRYPEGQVPKEQRAPVIYGNDLKAIVGLLSAEGFIAYERLSDFICEITNGVIKLSEGTIDNFLFDFAEKLDGELETIKTNLLNGAVMHVDETPMDVMEKPDYSGEEPIMVIKEQTSQTAYIRTHSNTTSTLYTVNPQKDIEGCERDKILPLYTGIISQDHEAKFYRYGTAHATCGAHLLRDLKGLFELQRILWANEMGKFISSINTYKNADLELGKTECNKEQLAFFENQYDILIESGQTALAALKEKEMGHDELRKMLARLTKYKDCYLLFIRDYRAPFTNNLAERDLRPDKTKQKVSGYFRSWEGFQNFAKIRSFISTLKKRSLNLFDSFSLVLCGTTVLDR